MNCEVDHCCCCIKLRTGTLIIGYIYLFFQVNTIILYCLGIGTGSYLENNPKDDPEEIGTIILIISSIFLIIELWCILFTILLLIGVHKNKRSLVKTYLIYTLIFLILSFLIHAVKTSNETISPVDLVLEICEKAIGGYFFIVINSYYGRMEIDSMKLSTINNYGRMEIDSIKLPTI